MKIINVHDAKTHQSRLLAQVEAGDEVMIFRDGEPVAQLVRRKSIAQRQPDVLKGEVVIPDSFFDPMSDEELSFWEGGL